MIAIMRTPISMLFQEARETWLAAGETLFVTAEEVADIYMVRSGSVHLLRHTRHGAQMVLQNAGPGAVVAEASVYFAAVSLATLSPARKASWLACRRSAFCPALADDPALGRKLVRAAGAQCSGGAVCGLKSGRCPGLQDRLDAWLEEGNRLPEKGRWQEVAGELGVTREALYRELSRRRT